MVLGAVLHHDHIVHVSRFYMPRRRPLETNWRQELRRWAWHLLVLPPEQAKPWPRCVQRFVALLAPARASPSATSDQRHWRPLTQRWRSRRRTFYSHRIPLTASLSRQFEAASESIHRAWSHSGLLVRLGTMVFAIAFLAIAGSTPLSLHEQLIMLVSMWGMTMILRRAAGLASGIIMMVFSIIASSRYIWWRLTQTLGFDSATEALFGAALIAAECYTWIVLVLGYVQNALPLGRSPVALPQNRNGWPTVDVYIPTYNEPLSVVRPTVLAALNIDWPADKLNIYVLDDGRRAGYREFATEAQVGYITRSDNAHAKAGNLNHALQMTQGEFIAVFDCDHIPARSFLETTMGWFLADPRCALLQTPHHFFSPDPFERNLGTFHRVPNEGSLFYGVTQDGNDLWNAAFFCGSCAVLRRSALEEVGGISLESVTEDAHTALRLHRRGYTTAYLRHVLAGGLAAESLSGYIGQRIRWARGMAQIFRLDNPLSGKGLDLFQRLCYANSMLHFFSAIPRLIFLVAPLMYLYFDLHVINAAALTLAAYAVPHMLQANLANSHMHGRYRHSFWNGAYEAVVSWYIAFPTALALLNPRRGRFNVTPKGGVVEQDFFDLRTAAPYLVLAVLNAVGALLAIPRLLVWNAFEADTVVVNLIWTIFNLITLGAVLGVAAELRQVREVHRVSRRMPALLYTCRGAKHSGVIEDFSMRGLGVTTATPHGLQPGESVTVALADDDAEHLFPGTVVSTQANRLGIALHALPIAKQREYVRCTFASTEGWVDSATSIDRPVASFAEVLLVAFTGYVRVLQVFSMGLFARRGRAQTRAL